MAENSLLAASGRSLWVGTCEYFIQRHVAHPGCKVGTGQICGAQTFLSGALCSLQLLISPSSAKTSLSAALVSKGRWMRQQRQFASLRFEFEPLFVAQITFVDWSFFFWVMANQAILCNKYINVKLGHNSFFKLFIRAARLGHGGNWIFTLFWAKCSRVLNNWPGNEHRKMTPVCFSMRLSHNPTIFILLRW